MSKHLSVSLLHANFSNAQNAAMNPMLWAGQDTSVIVLYSLTVIAMITVAITCHSDLRIEHGEAQRQTQFFGS